MLILAVANDQIIKIGETLIQVCSEGKRVRVLLDAPPEIRIARIEANTLHDARLRLATEGESCTCGFSKKLGGGSRG